MKKWADIKAQKMSPERIARVRSQAKDELFALTLRELREESGRSRRPRAYDAVCIVQA